MNRLFTKEAAWVLERLELRGNEVVIDVAAGTGQTARLLAPSVLAVVAVDSTAAMLAEGREQLERDGVRNVVLLRGDADDLRFADGTFDVAVTRFALRHFEDPAVPVSEMVRCVRAGGRVMVADLVASEDPAVAERRYRLERLRDPSHARALSAPELGGLLADAGLEGIRVEARSVEWPLGPWLEQSGAAEDVVGAIESQLRAELAGGPTTGFEPSERDGELHFVQTLASAVGVKPR